VALRRFRGSRVVSVDLKPLEMRERGCTAMILDFLSPGAEGKVKAALGEQPADLVMRRVP
jgi:23S rRNA U2552 (ribose-2'-O)-methylase RlmE/FtsJ